MGLMVCTAAISSKTLTYILYTNNKTAFNPWQMDFFKALLPVPEFSRALKFRRWIDQQAFLIGRFLLIEGLKQFGFQIELNLEYSAFGRPFLPLNLDFNISHSGEYVFLAISDNQRVGIDIEEIREITISDFVDQFTENEWEKICCSNNLYIEFFRIWTIKEAVIKADGRGLNVPMDKVIVAEDAMLEQVAWHIKKVNISPNYMVHLATDALVKDLFVKHVDVPGT